jgi:hypothetical protein
MPQGVLHWFAEMIEPLRADEALHDVTVQQMGGGLMKPYDFTRTRHHWNQLARGPMAPPPPRKMSVAEFEAANLGLGFTIEKVS